jgi:translation initiation factor IF-1
MGSDEAVVEEQMATVIQLLPNATVRVELENRQQVLAHAAGAAVKNFVRVRPGDRVWVELSPHDPGRGRITKLAKERG